MINIFEEWEVDGPVNISEIGLEDGYRIIRRNPDKDSDWIIAVVSNKVYAELIAYAPVFAGLLADLLSPENDVEPILSEAGRILAHICKYDKRRDAD